MTYCSIDTHGWLTEIFADEFVDDENNDGGDDYFEVEHEHVNVLVAGSCR